MVKLGRIFFAIPLGVFGIQYLIYGQWTGGLPPVPPWTPGGHIFAYVTGIVLLALSVSLLGKKEARFSASFAGFALSAVYSLPTRTEILGHYSRWSHSHSRLRSFRPGRSCIRPGHSCRHGKRFDSSS